MTLLRTLLIGLILVVFSLPAYAGELDGKALKCTLDERELLRGRKSLKDKYITFENGFFFFHYVSGTTPLRIEKSYGYRYLPFPHIIKFGIGKATSLNRSTLVLNYWHNPGKMFYLFNCKLIKGENIVIELEKEIDRIKQTMKNNKI